MDAKKTIDKLKGEADRVRMSLYLSQSVFDEFKAKCGELSSSRVIEELMKDFILSSKAHEKKSKSKK